MPYPIEKIKSYADVDKALDTGLPNGTYLMRGQGGEVLDPDTAPRLQLKFGVQLPKEQEGQMQSEFLRWFVPEVSETNDKPYEKRLQITRGISKRFLDDLADTALPGSPTSDSSTGQALKDAVKRMHDADDNLSAIIEGMELIAETLDGQEFFVKATKDGRFSRIVPIDYSKGARALGFGGKTAQKV